MYKRTDRHPVSHRPGHQLLGLLALLTLAGAAGCDGDAASIEYPREDYFENRQAWDDVVRTWRREYPNAYIERPARPWPKDYFNVKMLDQATWRIAVVGVIDARGNPPRGQAGEPSLGSGVQDRVRSMKWSTKTYPAAQWIDPRESLMTALNMELARVPGVTVVNRRDLKKILDERDLALMFASEGARTPPTQDLKGADAILVARASELEFMVYSVAKTDRTRRSIVIQNGRRAHVELRLIDVRSGDLLWSATTDYEPKHYLLAPIIIHPSTGEDVPQALRGLPKSNAAADAAYMLIKRLKSRLAGMTPSVNQRRKLGTHLNREW